MIKFNGVKVQTDYIRNGKTSRILNSLLDTYVMI